MTPSLTAGLLPLLVSRLKARAQAVQDCLVELRADGVELELLDDLLGEAVGQEVAREVSMQAATQKVEQLLFFELADGRAVRALHVVVENLKLRLGVHARLRREQEILVALLGVRSVRALVDEDATVEDGARASVQYALVFLAARAVRPLVVNERVRIRVLTVADDVEAVNATRRALAVKLHFYVVAREARAERHGRQVVGTVAREFGARRGDVERAPALVLHLVVRDTRTRADEDLDDGVREVGGLFRRRVRFDDVESAVAFGDDEHARERCALRLGRCGEEEQLHGRFYLRPGGDVKECAAAEEGRVERREGVAALFRESS